MDPLLNDLKQSAEKIIFHLKEDLKTIRTGRANPAIIDNLTVEAYEGQTKLRLMELATILTEGPAVLSITPFDPSIIGDIEKSILKSPLGLTPQTQGTKILIRIPSLSQEQREKMLKIIGQKIEEKKVIMRNFRDDVRKKIRLMLDKKEITEDDKFRLEKDVDSITQGYMTQIQEIKENKEKEILEV